MEMPGVSCKLYEVGQIPRLGGGVPFGYLTENGMSEQRGWSISTSAKVSNRTRSPLRAADGWGPSLAHEAVVVSGQMMTQL